MNGHDDKNTPTPHRNRLLLRGETAIASIGIALAAILLCSMAATAWWTVRTQHHSVRAARIEQARSVGLLLSQTGEAMLARGELSALRRLVTDTGRNHTLSQCRVILPGGGVIADADPSRITVRDIPETWPSGAVAEAFAETAGDHRVELRYPLEVTGRGRAELRIAASAGRPLGPFSFWETQAGVGAIGAAALFMLLVVYRYARSRLRAMGAIREALLAMGRGERDPGTLSVSEGLGVEAAAWNGLLDDAEEMRRAVTMERARQSLGDRRRGRGDLDDACDAMPQGLILVDEKMRAKYANGAAAVFLGVERDRLLHADIRPHITDEAITDVLTAWVNAQSRRRAVLESERSGEGDGPGGVLRWIIRPVRRDDSGAAMILIDDITQQRVAEEARHQFVAQATHELRTPLTNIRLYLGTALDEGENDAALRAKCLNVINSESRRLERIVNDLLSTAEMEAGSLRAKKDDVRLDEVFTQLREDYDAQAAEKEIDLHFDLPPKLPVIHGDRDMITLALHNLLGNALKYTPSGGKVRVNVSAEEDALAVDVVDSGIGIGEEDQPRIFEKFYRAHDRRLTEITGSGLGLALAREVVRLHGGDISVRSEIDKGSTFTMTVPGRGEAA